MLVTFHSNAYADITMFGDVALSLLKMMGHSGTIPSAMLAADLPAALKQLTQALASQQPQGSVDDDDAPVSLSVRALPLIEMLQASIAADCDVMWDS